MNKDHICLFPFYAFYYRGDDHRISSCCMQKPMLSTLPDGDIKSWWTGPDAQKIRQEFLDGKWPDSCKICKQQAEANMPTQRDKWHKDFMHDIVGSYDDLDVVKGNKYGEPFFVDYRPDNLCNLSCTMCNPGASSKIEQMVKDLGINYWHVSNLEGQNTQVKSMISEKTVRLKLNGGEPTINETIKEIYQYVIENNFAKNIRLQFTTNFTNYNKTFELLTEFKQASVCASIDGTGPTYEYIRSPAKWEVVKGNMLKYRELWKTDPARFPFDINCVWFTATAFTLKEWLPEMLDFVQENFPTARVNINQCQTPQFQNLSIIPDEYRKEIYNDIEYLRSQYTKKYAYIFNNLKFGLDNYKFNPKNLKDWQELNPKMDAYKKVDILKLHPRFKDLMDYNV